MIYSNRKNNSSFTLIELLVVLALVAILSVVVILTLNPAELIKQARDSNRLSDLSTINTALNLFSADVTSGFMGTSTVVYVSIPDNASSTCGSLGLPTLPTGYTYNCATTANLRKTDGSGWIPVNFGLISSNSPISQLPIDPVNATSTGRYYTYISGGSYVLTAIFESQKYSTDTLVNKNISGAIQNPFVYQVGNNLSLLAPPAPILWLKSDAGTTISGSSQVTVWADQSGNYNNATPAGGNINVAPILEQGRVNGFPALHFGSVCSAGACQMLTTNTVATDEETVIVVVKKSGSVTDNVIIGSSFGNSHHIYLDQYGGAAAFWRGCFSAGCGAYTNYIWGNDWSIATGIASVSGNNISVLKNGRIVAGPSSYTTTGVSGKYNIGYRYASAGYLDGWIAEILVYNSRLPDYFLRQIERYLSAKYGISL